MKGESGDLLGIKRKTADFLFDNGKNGNIHHIDLVSEKIKDEAVQNQATNDAILGGQSISQILANKAYQGGNFSATSANLSFTQASFSQADNGILNKIFGEGGILNGIANGNNTSLAQISNLEIKISFSFSSLQSASNGVSDKVSKIWEKVEENFAKIEEAKESFNKLQQGNLVDSLLKRFDENSIKEMNRLLFNPLASNFDTFKASLNLRNIHNLLSA